METSFGSWIKRRRKALDLTQGELAARVGCSRSAIFKIEANERRPSRQIAELLARHLEIPDEQRAQFLMVARGSKSPEALAPLSAPVVFDLQTTSQVPLSNLPQPPFPLVGRVHELGEIKRLLNSPECRLLTLAGPGGVGKTRLALQAALDLAEEIGHPFSDGLYFVALESLNAVEFIVPAIAEAIGFSFFSPGPLQVQLLNYLRDKHLLLILDNLEHLMDGAQVLAEILRRAPWVKLLVTSRIRLNLQSEWVFELQGLPVPPRPAASPGEEMVSAGLKDFGSMALFLQIARRVQPGFELSGENQAAIARICRALEGIPLGIELAASWVRMLSPQEIAVEIERDIDFLVATARDVPERHRSLRVTFDHSWKLLTGEERQTWEGLSVFQGGFERQAAIQVARASLPILTTLVDKSLLHRLRTDRYDMHELVRQYALGRLQKDPLQASEAYHRHSTYYLSWVSHMEEDIKGGCQPEAITRFNADIDNIRQAWDWAVEQEQITYLQEAAQSLLLFLEIQNLFAEGEDMFGRAQAMAEGLVSSQAGDGSSQTLLGTMMACRAWFSVRQGKIEDALALLKEGLRLLRGQENPVPLANALWVCSTACWVAGEFEVAWRSADECLSLNRTLNRAWDVANMTVYLGVIAHEQGCYDEAYRLLSQGMALSRNTGDLRMISFAVNFLARTALVLGRAAEMKAPLEEVHQFAIRVGDRYSTGLALERLAAVAQATAEIEEAHRLYDQSAALYQTVGDAWSLTRVLNLQGWFALEQGWHEHAWQQFKRAFEIAAAAQIAANALDALTGMAELSAGSGNPELGLTLAFYVSDHPSSTKEARERSERLRLQLKTRLPARQVKAARRRAQASTFESLADHIPEGLAKTALGDSGTGKIR